jgi:hypothetical protein
MFKRIFNWFKRKLGFGAVVSIPKVPTTEPTIEVAAPTNPLGSVATSKVILGNVQGIIAGEYKMIAEAVELANKVLSSQEFKDEVLKTRFTSTEGMTNADIFKKMTEQAIVNVTMFYGSYMQNFVWKTQGYEQGDGVVYANRYFITKAHEMASLIIHEVSHQKGFHHVHAGEYTSVPYRMNEIFETVSEQIGINESV